VLAGGGAVTTYGLQRRRTLRALEQLWTELARTGPLGEFDPDMVSHLPAPARRYLLRAIIPGTPLARAVQLRMHGGIRLQRKKDPAPFTAEQIIADSGYIWKARAQTGALLISGYDRLLHDEAELRWWVFDTLPVVSASGANVSKSAAGRLAGEHIFLPSLLLPQLGAQWQPINDASAIVRVTIGIEEVDVTVTVAENGRLLSLAVNRWNSSVENGPVGYLRFDVDELAGEKTFGGFTIPTRFRAGWRLGSRDAFPFFYGSIDSARYL
jgi:hypothetical protein